MIFEFSEKIEFMHSITVENVDEEDFEFVCREIESDMIEGYIDSKEQVIHRFREEFGNENVTFEEDGSGTVEFEAY